MYKVLIVDDDEEFLFIIGEYLGSHGIEFHLAQSAAQACKRLNHCSKSLPFP
jgi:CheY-like chemotaxis protein